MAQKDSKVMMELAADSKRDSYAMKTISILGMFFLPGTFVAVSQMRIEVVDI
jgi:Mg2+ and Co2+ transporter CorA